MRGGCVCVGAISARRGAVESLIGGLVEFSVAVVERFRRPGCCALSFLRFWSRLCEFLVLRFVREFRGSTSVAGGDRRTLPVRTAVV